MRIHKHSLCEHVVLIPTIQVLRRLRQADHCELEASLDDLVTWVRERTRLYVKEREIHLRVRDGSRFSHEALGPDRCS